MPRMPSRLRPIAAALALAAGATAYGQTAEKERSLEPIIIRADTEKSLTVPSIERAERDIRRIPGGAEIVDPATYETGRSSTLSDALGLATGVFVQPRFGSDEARISIRGSGIQRTFHGRGSSCCRTVCP